MSIPDHGYFWIERFKDEVPQIAYRTKAGDWMFIGHNSEEYCKMVRRIGYLRPFKVLYPVKQFNAKYNRKSRYVQG